MVGSLLRRNGAAGDSSVPGVDAADYVAIAVDAAATGVTSTSRRVAYLPLTRLGSASLTTLRGPPWLLATPARLSALSGLPITRELAGLELLAARLTRLALRIGTLAEPGKLVAQTREVVHGTVDRGVL